MHAPMRAKRGAKLRPNRSGARWANRVVGKRAPSDAPLALLLLFMAIVLAGAVVGFFGWTADRHLRESLFPQREEAAQRPDWVNLAELPDFVPAAFLSAADPRFLERRRLLVQTEETLTRELLRQVYRLQPDLQGQAQELLMAALLDYSLPRQQVLELYLNRVYLGEHEGARVFGLHRAAREYFDKQPQELTLGEAATLAGILLPPPLAEPARWPGALGARRNEILRRMAAQERLGPGEFEQAMREPLRLEQAAAHTPMTQPAAGPRQPQVIRVPPPQPAPSSPPAP